MIKAFGSQLAPISRRCAGGTSIPNKLWELAEDLARVPHIRSMRPLQAVMEWLRPTVSAVPANTARDGV